MRFKWITLSQPEDQTEIINEKNNLTYDGFGRFSKTQNEKKKIGKYFDFTRKLKQL